MIPGILAQRRVVSGGGTLWTPLNMTTVPQIYLDAQDSTVTDVSGFASAISNLGAMGSNGDFSQATAGSRPAILDGELNGKRVLRFDADVLVCNTTPARAIFRNVAAAWSFVVYKKRGLDGSPTSRYMIYAPKNDNAVRFGVLVGDSTGGRANKPFMFARRLDADIAASLQSPNVVQGAYFLSAASIDFITRAGFLRENGTEAASNSTLTASTGNTSDTAAPSSPLAVGAYFTGSLPADVDIAAVVIGNFQPSTGEFEKLEGWAAHKYGLTANLPSGHPYKTGAPTV